MYRVVACPTYWRWGICSAVMQTLLDLENRKKNGWSGWLPDCQAHREYRIWMWRDYGPLIQFGLEHGLSAKHDGLPTVIYAGHNYDQQFCNCNNSLLCKEILGDRRIPLPCIRSSVMPRNFTGKPTAKTTPKLYQARQEAFHILYSYLSANDFHCAIPSWSIWVTLFQ